MSTQDHPYPRVEFLIDTFADWLKHRRELSEIRQMDRSDFERIASDLRVSPGELDTLVDRGPHAVDELPKLLAFIILYVVAQMGPDWMAAVAPQWHSTRWEPGMVMLGAMAAVILGGFIRRRFAAQQRRTEA